MSTSCSVGLSDSSSINLKRFFIIDGYRTVLPERCAVAVWSYLLENICSHKRTAICNYNLFLYFVFFLL